MLSDDLQTLDGARDLTRKAALWLVIIGHQNHPAAPFFSPSISTYSDMVDPESSDARRLAACEKMRDAIARCITVEQLLGEAAHYDFQALDPFSCAWKTTPRGAALETISTLLEIAIQRFKLIEWRE